MATLIETLTSACRAATATRPRLFSVCIGSTLAVAGLLIATGVITL